MSAAPITAKKLEKCLDRLAVEIARRGDVEGAKILPLYRRFETELAIVNTERDVMASVRQRLTRSPNQTAARSS